MYDAVIIGSGYGGSVVAARLAGRAKVLLIERGRRYPPGDFPSTLAGLVRAYRRRENPLGLWSMRLGEGTGNATISGLGGASLVNYGITAHPRAGLLDSWPVGGQELQPYYARALEVLAPRSYPEREQLADVAFLDRLEPGRRVDLENTIDWDRCTHCGNCPTGCNEGAKRSLDHTYLPLALDAGLELALETEALACRPRAADDGAPAWELTLRPTTGGALTQVRTRRVVLAAGTFGSLDFLQRIRDEVPLAAGFGRGLSMNGDALFFLYNTNVPLSGEQGAPLTTTARFELDETFGAAAGRRVTIISGRVPKLMAPLAGAALALVSPLLPGGRRAGSESESWRRRLSRSLRDLSGVAAGGALAQTFMYKVDAEDGARGQARFVGDEAVMDWPDYRDDPVLRFAHERLERWAEQVGGRVIAELGSWPLMRGRSFGVHPLGGCALAEGPERGAVDTRLRLFRPDGGVYPGFRVVDGSVMPGALGVPPSLTIAALAERAAEDLLAELGR